MNTKLILFGIILLASFSNSCIKQAITNLDEKMRDPAKYPYFEVIIDRSNQGIDSILGDSIVYLKKDADFNFEGILHAPNKILFISFSYIDVYQGLSNNNGLEWVQMPEYDITSHFDTDTTHQFKIPVLVKSEEILYMATCEDIYHNINAKGNLVIRYNK